MDIDISDSLSEEQARVLVKEASAEKQDLLVKFLVALFRAYTDLHFTYLEINPLGQFIHLMWLLNVTHCACSSMNVYVCINVHVTAVRMC